MQKTQDFLKREPLLYADVAEGVKWGRVSVLYQSETALLAVNTAGHYLLCSTDYKGAGTALTALPADFKRILLIAHGNAAREAAVTHLNVKRETKCHQCVYLGGRLPLRGDLDFLPPDRNSVDLMKSVYALETPEKIEQMAAEGKILTAYKREKQETAARGAFVGFIGSHDDGSMGMLHVFDAHRRHGYAEEIESAQINRWLEAGKLPYGHVIDGNEASYRLQEKLGMRFADEWVTWIFAESE